MINERFVVLALFSLVVVVSGCTNAEINRNPQGEITLSGNESQDLTIWVSNNLGETTEFQADFVVNESQEYLSITDSGTGDEISSVDLGEAQDGEPTVKQGVTLSGNPAKLRELNVDSVTTSLKIEVYREPSVQVVGGEQSPVDTEIVDLEVAR